jgi:hypothetical protein
MRKQHIRSYRITDSSDVEVVDQRGVIAVDLSPHYEDEPRDRGGLRLETCLDVFSFTDGQLVWSASANGQDNAAAASLAWLLDLYLADLSGTAGEPRTL